jgi:sec-independent protein translocase protein TatB
MKAEASKFKSQIEETKASLTIDTKVDLGLKDIMNDDLNIATSIDNKINKMEETKQEKVSFKKDEKKEVNA